MAENDKMSCQSPAEPAHHILIVEDSENSAATMEMTLSDIPGTSVLRAPSGREALQILNRPGSRILAVVNDLNMPKMDERIPQVPIIVVSADTDPDTPERIAQMKVDAFFAKPYSPAQVRRKLEQLLHATTD